MSSLLMLEALQQVGKQPMEYMLTLSHEVLGAIVVLVAAFGLARSIVIGDRPPMSVVFNALLVVLGNLCGATNVMLLFVHSLLGLHLCNSSMCNS